MLRHQQFPKANSAYINAIRQTVQQGGDTDTNACIVGGMMGALVGIKRVPKEMLDTVLNFDCVNSGKGIKRPDFLSVGRHAIPNI